jgi:hypothetical protein
LLLTLATANRKPLLALWWKYTQIVTARPVWQRIAMMGLVLASGMVVAGLPLLFIIYLRVARGHVARQVKAELSGVRLKAKF